MQLMFVIEGELFLTKSSNGNEKNVDKKQLIFHLYFFMLFYDTQALQFEICHTHTTQIIFYLWRLFGGQSVLNYILMAFYMDKIWVCHCTDARFKQKHKIQCKKYMSKSKGQIHKS